MKKYISIIASFAILAFVAGSALADSSAKDELASKYVGAQAIGTNGEHLGTINDILVGPDGQASYLVIAKSDQSRLAAIPFETAAPQVKSNGQVVLAISRDQFDVVPSFASNDWPALTSQTNSEARGYRGDTDNKAMDPEKNVVNGISTWNPYIF